MIEAFLDHDDVDPTRIDINFDPTVQRMRGYTYHGDTPFDVPFISQISDDLWQGGCENGLVLPWFFRHVISLYQWEQYTTTHELDTMMTVKMYDSTDQAFTQIEGIAAWANACRETGPVLIHCQAGLNRSALVAATALMIGPEQMTSNEAIAHVRATRSPACLCNPSFEEWLRDR